MSSSEAAESALSELYCTFITACHILHKNKVFDAFGHLSVRDPRSADRFIMPRSVAPGLVASQEDLIVYRVSDASPLAPNARPGYSERCIHSEIYKALPHINAVVHSHSYAVVPYSIVNMPLLPCNHMTGFLGPDGPPIFDIAKHYEKGDIQNMLVSNTRLGAFLASTFSQNATKEKPHAVVLMRGHGLTIVGSSIKDVVTKSIYTQVNAEMQTAALTISGNNPSTGSQTLRQRINFLSEEECMGAIQMQVDAGERPWELWCREVEADPFYENRE